MNQLVQQIPVQQVPVTIDLDDDSVDLPSYAGFIAENRWLIAGIALVVTLIGVAIAFIAKPMYEATLLIQVESATANKKDPLTGVTSNYDKVAAASEMEILKSRMVVSRAVDNLKLYIDVQPKYFPGIGSWLARGKKQISDPGLLGYGGWVWGGERADISVFNVPEELEGKGFVLTAVGGDRFRITQEDSGIRLEGKVGETLAAQTGNGEIELTIQNLDANPGAQFTVTRFARVEVIEKLQNTLFIAEKGKQSGVIGVGLEWSDPKLASSILNEIGREYMRQNMDRKSEEAEKSLAFLNKQLPDLKREVEASESALNELRNRRGIFDLSEETKSVLQQTTSAQTKLIDLKQKREAFATRFADEHPEIVGIDRQIRVLNRELGTLDARIKKLPEMEQELLRLTRDMKVNTELYTSLLRTAQELRLATASKVGNVRLLDTAMAPVEPTRPKRLLIISSAALSGLLLGLFAAFTRKNLSNRIADPVEVKQLLKLPVSATIPHSEIQDQLNFQMQSKTRELAVLSHKDPTDSAVESLRGLRASLQFSMRDSPNNIILITGPTPGVGKSFVSANFASVLASSGKKVLLIDADLRTGHLHRYFGLDRENGLADTVFGKTNLSDVIRKNVVENVDFIATGNLPENPAELLAHENFGKLLQRLSSHYHFVLIDTPPVLAVADALAVATHSGAIFNIVRGGVSTKTEIEESVKRLNLAGHIVTGVVFNDSRGRHSRYGYELAYGKYPQTA